MAVDQLTRITLAQSINLAKDIAIAQKGNKVTVDDIAALLTEVYVKLFKEAAKDTYNSTLPPPSGIETVEQFIEAFKLSKDPVTFRNNNRDLLAAFSKEERDRILTTIG